MIDNTQIANTNFANDETLSNTNFTKNSAGSFFTWSIPGFNFELNVLDDLVAIVVNANNVYSIFNITPDLDVHAMFAFPADDKRNTIVDELDIDDAGMITAGRKIEYLPEHNVECADDC